MRFLLLLALILYDILTQARSGFDYEDLEGKHHAFAEDRRTWRKKALEQGSDGENGLRGQHGYNSGSGRSPEIFEEKEQKPLRTMSCDRPHERYEPCFSGCAAVSCDNPRDRLRPCYPFCEPGCVCVPPYLRDDRTHKCVLPDECTKGLKGVPDIGDES